MSDIQSQFVKNILEGVCIETKESGSAFAPSNIALCKYWGKRDVDLNLPVNSSLSVSLGRLGTRTQIKPSDSDDIYLNGDAVPADAPFAARLSAFLDLFRSCLGIQGFEVHTENMIPTAAGLASSASGFAALVRALDELAGWGLDPKRLSMLARLGSGSAARSLYHGFVEWHAGAEADGSDSFAERLPIEWPEFRIGVLELSRVPKPVGSRDGMNRTVESSLLYQSWPAQAAADLKMIRSAVDRYDFSLLGRTAERNALAMHATMMAAWPPLIYLQPETVAQIRKVQAVRQEGLDIYLTIDAGPNIKLLFLQETERDVLASFPGLQVIQPFDRQPE